MFVKPSFFFFLYILSHSTLAQKASLDASVFNKWISVGGGLISDNGKYACYFINNEEGGKSKLVISELDNDWKKEFVNASIPTFTSDGKWIVFKKNRDSLCLLG